MEQTPHELLDQLDNLTHTLQQAGVLTKATAQNYDTIIAVLHMEFSKLQDELDTSRLEGSKPEPTHEEETPKAPPPTWADDNPFEPTHELTTDTTDTPDPISFTEYEAAHKRPKRNPITKPDDPIFSEEELTSPVFDLSTIRQLLGITNNKDDQNG